MLPDRDLVMEFESIGDNCEFGLVQRMAKAEPLGLLRFAFTPISTLIACLNTQFELINHRDHVAINVSPREAREYMIKHTKYHIVYHTGVCEHQATIEDVYENEIKKLTFLKRRMLEDLTNNEKIFVRKGMVSEEHIAALYKALRQYGPNWLMWTVLADDDHKSGDVEIVSDGFMKAYIDRFAPPENAHRFAFDSWIALCGNALPLWPKGRPTEPSAPAAG